MKYCIESKENNNGLKISATKIDRTIVIRKQIRKQSNCCCLHQTVKSGTQNYATNREIN